MLKANSAQLAKKKAKADQVIWYNLNQRNSNHLTFVLSKKGKQQEKRINTREKQSFSLSG